MERVEYGLSAGISGALAVVSGLDHAYRAMLAAVVPFMAVGTDGPSCSSPHSR